MNSFVSCTLYLVLSHYYILDNTVLALMSHKRYLLKMIFIEIVSYEYFKILAGIKKAFWGTKISEGLWLGDLCYTVMLVWYSLTSYLFAFLEIILVLVYSCYIYSCGNCFIRSYH